jgi:hypothetical protein
MALLLISALRGAPLIYALAGPPTWPTAGGLPLEQVTWLG